MAVSEVLGGFEYHFLNKQDSQNQVHNILVSNIIQTKYSSAISYALVRLLVILTLLHVILCQKDSFSIGQKLPNVILKFRIFTCNFQSQLRFIADYFYILFHWKQQKTNVGDPPLLTNTTGCRCVEKGLLLTLWLLPQAPTTVVSWSALHMVNGSLAVGWELFCTRKKRVEASHTAFELLQK